MAVLTVRMHMHMAVLMFGHLTMGMRVYIMVFHMLMFAAFRGDADPKAIAQSKPATCLAAAFALGSLQTFTALQQRLLTAGCVYTRAPNTTSRAPYHTRPLKLGRAFSSATSKLLEKLW